VFSKDANVSCDPTFSSVYHLPARLVNFHWNKHDKIESYVMLMDQNDNYKVMMLFPRPSLYFPSKFRIFEGNCVDIKGEVKSFEMGSLVSFIKFKIFTETIYGKLATFVVSGFAMD
jgi:hypothetical protein